jgi:hypothetical protein
MANIVTPYSVTLGATDYPAKYAGLLAYLEGYLNALELLPPGTRNKIINGRMEIAQRGTSFAAPASGSYVLDRWVQFNTSAAFYTVSQQADAPSSNEFQNSLRIAITTADASIAAGDLVTLRQWVEGYNARDLIGRTFTLSFWVRSSKTGVHCVSFRNTGANRAYIVEYTVSAANTWEQKSITLSGGLITAGTWDWTTGQGVGIDFVLAAGSTFQATAGAWQTGNLYATSAQVNCLDSTSNIFAITGVQLEVGSVATPFEHRPFEHRPFGVELDLCRRYYRQFTDNFVGYAPSAGIFGGRHTPLAPPMRATPTVTNSGVTGVNVGAYTTAAVNTTEFNIQVSAAAAGQFQAQSTITLAIEL